MAIIPCRECAHHVSDQAASCPSCGAPIAVAAAKTKPRGRQRLSRVLITLMALWTLGTVLWLTLPSWTRDAWISRAQFSLQRFDRNVAQTAPKPPAAVPVSTQPAPAPVPAPALAPAKDSTVATALDEIKGAAAAQLYKDESLDIKCDQIGRSGTVLQGSGCSVTFVDTKSGDAKAEETKPNVRPNVTHAKPHRSARRNAALIATKAVTSPPEPESEADTPIAAERAGHAKTNTIRLASADGAYIGGATTVTRVPETEATVAHATPASPPPSVPTPDDLARVRATDPGAAAHIATYCSKSPALANRETLIADCRRSEADAWTRLVLQNEFPTLDDATRKKCSEPPFPDTYVAKESCARYELRAN